MSHQAQNMRINKFLIMETGSYNPQYRRPYNTTLDGHTLNVLAERLAGATDYVPGQLGDVANQFIAPQATPEKMIEMPQGWQERRMRFMLEIEVELYMGTTVKEIVMGYTDYVGATVTGSLDPQMQFFVNSTAQVRNSMQQTPLGNQVYSSVTDNSHVLVDHNWAGIYSDATDKRLRPEDVYATMSRTHLQGLGNVQDVRVASTQQAVKSRRQNGSAANYMARILSDYKKASTVSEFGQGENEVLMQARTHSQENLVSNDHFLAAIAQIRGTPQVSNVFQYRDLQQLDPNVVNVTRASIMGDAQKAKVHQYGQTADWGSSDRETVAATVLSQAIPALMMEVGLTVVGFRSTNHDIGGLMTTMFYEAQSFSNQDQSQAIETLKQRMEQYVLASITYGNQIGYMIDMKVDLLGESWLRISLDNGPMIDYVVPQFCDAQLVPVLTTNDQLAVTLASDFEGLSHALVAAETQHHPGIMSAGGSAFGNI